MNTTMLLIGLCGVGAAAGVILITIGMRKREPTPLSIVLRWKTRQHTQGRSTSVRWLAIAIAAGILAAVATGWVVGGVLVLLAMWLLPSVWGRNKDHAERINRLEAIAGWTEMLRDTLAAAAGLEQAILATVDIAPEAIRDDVQALAARIKRGEHLTPALRTLANDLADPTADLVVSALIIAAEHPARQLTDMLSELASTAREHVSMRLRIEADRAQTRTSVRMIVGTTIVFATGLVALNRSYLDPYNSAVGQLILLVVGGLFGLAFWWLHKITRVLPPERFLPGLSTVAARKEVSK